MTTKFLAKKKRKKRNLAEKPREPLNNKCSEFCGKKTSIAYKLKLGIPGARVGVSFFVEFTSLDLLRCPVVDRKQIHIYNKSFGEFYRYTRFANKSGVDEHVAKLKNSVNEV